MNAVVALVGIGSIYPFLRASSVIKSVDSAVTGRLLVLFPGLHDQRLIHSACSTRATGSTTAPASSIPEGHLDDQQRTFIATPLSFGNSGLDSVAMSTVPKTPIGGMSSSTS